MEFKIEAQPFSWNENFSEVAQEDFSLIQKDLPYGVSQSIGMALAKLELLEKQGCKVIEKENESCATCVHGGTPPYKSPFSECHSNNNSHQRGCGDGKS